MEVLGKDEPQILPMKWKIIKCSAQVPITIALEVEQNKYIKPMEVKENLLPCPWYGRSSMCLCNIIYNRKIYINFNMHNLKPTPKQKFISKFEIRIKIQSTLLLKTKKNLQYIPHIQ